MSKKTESLPKQSKDLDNLNATDRTILMVASENPEASKFEIAKQVQQIRGLKSVDTIYKSLRKKDYMNADFERVKRHNLESLHRELYPLVHKQVKSVLKDKDTPEEVKRPYRMKVMDKAHMEDRIPSAPPGNINIGSIQVLVEGNLDRKE